MTYILIFKLKSLTLLKNFTKYLGFHVYIDNYLRCKKRKKKIALLFFFLTNPRKYILRKHREHLLDKILKTLILNHNPICVNHKNRLTLIHIDRI